MAYKSVKEYLKEEVSEKKYLFEMEKAKNKLLLGVGDCSLLSGMSVSTIRRAIDSGELKYHQIKNRSKLIIKRVWLDEWIGL